LTLLTTLPMRKNLLGMIDKLGAELVTVMISICCAAYYFRLNQ
jgi:hypothetical protein